MKSFRAAHLVSHHPPGEEQSRYAELRGSTGVAQGTQRRAVAAISTTAARTRIEPAFIRRLCQIKWPRSRGSGHCELLSKEHS